MTIQARINDVFWQGFSQTEQDGIIKEQRAYATIQNITDKYTIAFVQLVSYNEHQVLAEKQFLVPPKESKEVFVFYAGGNWDAILVIRVLPRATIDISNVRKDIDYIPTKAKEQGTEYPSSAKIVIGDIVSADVILVRDDAFGTYTGTPYQVITRPAHCIHHAIVDKFGFDSTEIDASSFAAAVSEHITQDFSFDFVSPFEIGVESTRVSAFLHELAKQCRSVLYWKAGKWYLDYIPDTQLTADKIISKNDLNKNSFFIFNLSSRNEIKNNIRTYYGYNYTRQGLVGVENEWRNSVELKSAASIERYGERKEDLHLWAIENTAMANKITTFQLKNKRSLFLSVEFSVLFENFDLQYADTIQIVNDLYDGTLFFVEEINRRDKVNLTVRGRSWLPFSNEVSINSLSLSSISINSTVNEVVVAESVPTTWETEGTSNLVFYSDNLGMFNNRWQEAVWASAKSTNSFNVNNSVYIGEFLIRSYGNVSIGITNGVHGLDIPVGENAGGYGYRKNDGYIGNNDSWQAYGNTFSSGSDVISIAVSGGKIWFAKNGVWQNSGNPETDANPAFSGLSGIFYIMGSCYDVDSDISANFGASDFTYDVPSGFKSGLDNA